MKSKLTEISTSIFQVLDGHHGILVFFCAFDALESTGTWAFTYHAFDRLTSTLGLPNKLSLCNKWEIHEPVPSMRLSYRMVFDDRKPILHWNRSFELNMNTKSIWHVNGCRLLQRRRTGTKKWTKKWKSSSERRSRRRRHWE